MKEGVNSNMIYYKIICKYHNVPPPSTTIKKEKSYFFPLTYFRIFLSWFSVGWIWYISCKLLCLSCFLCFFHLYFLVFSECPGFDINLEETLSCNCFKYFFFLYVCCISGSHPTIFAYFFSLCSVVFSV
jgi:hypothetical protein